MSDCQTLYTAPLTPPYSYRTPGGDVSNMFHLLITSAADDRGKTGSEINTNFIFAWHITWRDFTILSCVVQSLSSYLQFSNVLGINHNTEYCPVWSDTYQMHWTSFNFIFLSIPFGCDSKSQWFTFNNKWAAFGWFQFPLIKSYFKLPIIAQNTCSSIESFWCWNK